MKKDPPIVKNLIAARGHVEHGWVKGAFCLDKQGNICEPAQADSVCALSAIAKVLGISSLGAPYTPEATYLARAVRKRNNPHGIVAFNDDPYTTKDLVIRKFSIAIGLARRDHNQRVKDHDRQTN